MISLIQRFWRGDEGATATEYAILLIFAVTVIAFGLKILGASISNLFSTVGTTLDKAPVHLP